MTTQQVSQSKEVRFAVVMYGGVSLAIYINGVAQELYNLVKATAIRTDGDGNQSYLFNEEELNGAGKIYRELGKMLDARFVVDILSGTSAGGINAVFLAKALANGETFEQLRDLWIQEGDIGVLINDTISGLDKEGLKFGGEPASLLNSQRMYYKLLYALDTMSPEQPASGTARSGKSPYVEELDLFVTATDIRGLVQQTKLADATSEEYRYKNVFRFRYATPDAAGGEGVNDFKRANNPFLAFAARCTSAFPFAFEPMRLDDVRDVVATPAFRANYKYNPALWTGFYEDYLSDADDSGSGFEQRSFGDGGYLDNKPFSYATETLLRRRADLPVDRKLVYIEPSPEHPAEKDIAVRPNALENVAAALVKLPRYETIRDDLGAILERNQLIERVGIILDHIRHTSQASLNQNVQAWQMSGVQWAGKYLDQEVLGAYGPGYAAYHQLRVSSVLDDLASGLARAMGRDENGEWAQSFRQKTLEGWREAYYRIDPQPAFPNDTRKSENDLLFRLDISWRIRRLQFMHDRIDALLAGLANPGQGVDEESRQKAVVRAQRIVRDSLGWEAGWPFEPNEQGDADNESSREAYRQALLQVKSGFNDAYKELRASGRELRSRNLLARIEKQGVESVAQQTDKQELRQYAKRLRALKDSLDRRVEEKTIYQAMEDLSEALASGEAHPPLKGAVRTMLSQHARRCQQVLGNGNASAGKDDAVQEPASTANTEALSKVQACLGYYYDRFEYYDMLIYPLFFGTEVGESDVVEIVRISPEDATSLRAGSQKLAGTKLSNFGAFFVQEWRENDILWGRLDGAECLIKALMPGEDQAGERERLTREAHQAILEETFLGADQKQLFEYLISRQFENADSVKAAMSRALGGSQGLLERFKSDYKVDTDFPPEATLKISARASRVTGQVLSGLSRKGSSSLLNPGRALGFLGSIVNGLVQLTIPKSKPNRLFKFLVWPVYLLELLLVIYGLAGRPGLTALGVVLLALTLAVHWAVASLQALLKRKSPAQAAKQGLAQVLLVLIGLVVGFLAYRKWVP